MRIQKDKIRGMKWNIPAELKLCIAVSCVAPIAIFGGLYFFQEKIIFQRQPENTATAELITSKYPDIQKISLQTNDGFDLAGWILPAHATGDSSSPRVMLYFGGNASEASTFFYELGPLRDWTIVSLNYRGYGHSTGTPSEAALVADAGLLFDFVKEKYQPQEIAVIGRSLGTGVAAQLAAARPVDRLVLVTPFESMLAMAHERLPWVPGFLLRNQFRSDLAIQKTKQPTLFIIAGQDEVVPTKQQETLAALMPAATIRTFPQEGHNQLQENPEYWRALAGFLNQE